MADLALLSRGKRISTEMSAQLQQAASPQDCFVIDMENYIKVIFILAFTPIFDWLMYDGTYKSIRAFYSIPDHINYKYFFFPRILIIIAAAILFAVATYDKQTNFVMAAIATAVFFIASFYPQVRTFMAAKRY